MPTILPNPEYVVRIDRILNPEHRERGEGLYEWRYLKRKYQLDFLDLLKEIEGVMPGRSEDVVERLMNFPRVFLVLNTGEIFSDTIPTGESQYQVGLMDW